MSNFKYVGDPSKAVRVRTERDPTRGVRQTAVYTFVNEITANAFIGTLGLNQQYVKEMDPPGWTVTVYTPDFVEGAGDPDTTETWELLANQVEKDLYEHPTSKALHKDAIKAIKTYLKNMPSGYDIPRINPSDPASAVSGEAVDLFNLLLKGTTKFPADEIVFRYTLTISSRSALRASFANRGKIFTPAQLVNPAYGGLAAVPAGIGFAINEIDDPTTIAEGYTWGWLKKTPTTEQTTRGKVVIKQEWWLDLWSTFIFKTATNPPTPP